MTIVREFQPPILPSWLTIEREYDCDDEAAARAIAYLISHPVSGLPLSDDLSVSGAQDTTTSEAPDRH